MTVEEKIIKDLVENIKLLQSDEAIKIPEELRYAIDSAARYLAKPKDSERAIKMVEEYAIKEGFSEEEIKPCTMDGFSKMTKSGRILRMCSLAYYRGWKRGIKTEVERRQVVTLR